MKQLIIDILKESSTLIIVLIMGLMFFFGIAVEQSRYDYPEEFNPQTISRDVAHPTKMTIVFDTLRCKYVFEFNNN